MRKLLKTFYWLLLAALAAAAAFGLVVLRRSHQLETMIVRAAMRRNVDSRTLFALAEKCSKFQTSFADHGRYGLLALEVGDGRAWAAATKSEFDTFDLFDPQKNLEIGAWKLGDARRAWPSRDADIWALAEWKTNREAVRVWADASRGVGGDAARFIADDTIRKFVEEVSANSRRDEYEIAWLWRPLPEGK